MSKHDVALSVRLRRDADRYRELAGGALSWDTALHLIELAEECEREAAVLVEGSGDRKTTYE